MSKRLLDCSTSDLVVMTKQDKLESISASEGRVIVSEVIGCFPPALWNISNAELACAFGADILLLNALDFDAPVFLGVPEPKGANVIREIKRLTGRLVGVNLEPVDSEGETIGEIKAIPKGMQASVETAKKAIEFGADMIALTGNPGTGVTNRAIISSLREISRNYGDKIMLMAGKMHASGSLKEAGENIITERDIKEFKEAGADIILIPAPGTVPGITMEYVHTLVSFAHSEGMLTML